MNLKAQNHKEEWDFYLETSLMLMVRLNLIIFLINRHVDTTSN